MLRAAQHGGRRTAVEMLILGEKYAVPEYGSLLQVRWGPGPSGRKLFRRRDNESDVQEMQTRIVEDITTNQVKEALRARNPSLGEQIAEGGRAGCPVLWDCSLEAVASGSTRGHSDPSRGSFGALRGAGAPAGRIRPNRYKYASESACATGCLSRPPERIGAAPGAPMVYGSRITRFQPQTGIVHTCIYRLFTADLQSCRDCST